MKARNLILTLVTGAALLLATGASAQTEGKLFEGASTYFLAIATTEKCGVSDAYARKRAMFPLSFVNLKEGTNLSSDFWISLEVNIRSNRDSKGRCYGVISISADAITWNAPIPFNKKRHFAEAPLFSQNFIVNHTDLDGLGDAIEDLMKELVTAINMDNK